MAARNEKGRAGYFLVSGSLGFWPLTMTLIATLIGGGSTLGAAEEAYRHGWIIFLYPLGGSLGFVLLALGISKKLNRYNVTTIAQIMEVAYKSAWLKKIASLLSIIALTSILIGQIIAAHKFMNSLAVSNELIFLAFWLIIILYTAAGGLRAVAVTDVLNGIFFIVALAICFVALPSDISLSGYTGGPSYDINKVVAWFLMPLLFMLIEQDIGQRSFAASSQKTFTLAALTAAFLSLLMSLAPICLGMAANSMAIEVPLGSSVLICAITYLTNPWITAIAGCAVMAAIVSTANSEINAISSNVSQDFTDKLKLNSIKVITVLIAVLSVALSYLFHNIIDLIIISFELAVYCLFVPIMMALFKNRHHKISAILSLISGGLAFLLLKCIGCEIVPHPVIALTASLAGFGLGELYSYKTT